MNAPNCPGILLFTSRLLSIVIIENRYCLIPEKWRRLRRRSMRDLMVYGLRILIIGRVMYSKIIIPLDGSKTAENALPYARYLARCFGIPVELAPSRWARRPLICRRTELLESSSLPKQRMLAIISAVSLVASARWTWHVRLRGAGPKN